MNIREWWRWRRQHGIFGDHCKICRRRMNHRGITLGLGRRVVYVCDRCAARVHDTLEWVRREYEVHPSAFARYESKREDRL